MGFGLGLYKYGGKSFANNATPKGVLSDPGRPGDDQIKGNLARWYTSHRGLDNAGKIAYLTGGTQFISAGMSNIDAQFVEAMNLDAYMVSRILNIPPFLLGLTDSSGVKMAEQVNHFVRFTLNDWIRTWAEEMRMKLLTEEEWQQGDLFFKFDTSDYFRTNFVEYLQALVTATGGAVLKPNEARELLDLNPTDDRSEFLARSTGAPDDSKPNSNERLDQVENYIQKFLINNTQSLCKTESSKLQSALGRDKFAAWSDDFYRNEWKARLADVVSTQTAEQYCKHRTAEVRKLFENSGRGAVESDLANFRARGLRLVEMEMQNNGFRITQA